jgi:hypothetical protein
MSYSSIRNGAAAATKIATEIPASNELEEQKKRLRRAEMGKSAPKTAPIFLKMTFTSDSSKVRVLGSVSE